MSADNFGRALSNSKQKTADDKLQTSTVVQSPNFKKMKLSLARTFRVSWPKLNDQVTKRSKDTYKWFLPFQTRWLDNDRYGHMNNAVYHGIFDSVINVYLIRHCGLDINTTNSSTVGFMVTNKCEFFGPAKYPDIYLIGMRVPKIGKTSLHYQLGMFPLKDSNTNLTANMTHGYFQNDLKELNEVFEENASCVGDSVHVFVDPSNNNKPKPIPTEWSEQIKKIHS